MPTLLIPAAEYQGCAASKMLAGVDEAGRGPLAGPVVAAAVILEAEIFGLDDSKKLSEKRREALAAEICNKAPYWALGWACRAEIDHLNILQATFLAMRRAIQALKVVPDMVFIDGNRVCGSGHQEKTVIRGDGKILEIAAASILAKVARDRWMQRLSQQYPQYGFERHKGYGTKAHLAALQCHGPTAEHRRSFAPVRNLL